MPSKSNMQKSAIENDMVDLTEKKSTLDRAFGELFGADNLLKKTDLTRNEIADISIILTFARRFGFDWLENLVYNFLELMISNKRKGRTEMVSVAQADLIQQKAIAQAYAQMDKVKKRG